MSMEKTGEREFGPRLVESPAQFVPLEVRQTGTEERKMARGKKHRRAEDSPEAEGTRTVVAP
jgi:hypothetical protein